MAVTEVSTTLACNVFLCILLTRKCIRSEGRITNYIMWDESFCVLTHTDVVEFTMEL